MAEVTFIAPVDKIEGKLNKNDKTIFRFFLKIRLAPLAIHSTTHL